MTQDWQRIEQLFFDALDHTPGERAAFLSEMCQGDDALRAEVESMLAAHEGEHRLSPERWEDAHGAPDRAAEAMIGQRVGAYRIERLIGHGGMGNVYLAARDDEHYEHKVAVKLMRPGLHAAEMAERFRRERQILAHLEHPNIAPLLDGGISDDGRPYLVMQYVDGTPITDYCEAHKLRLRERLQLFRTVCAAVQAAHVQLVVHRDLKPANILVTPSGEVKLLDFGIAKLLEPESDALTTRPFERVMTPEHAAPEQVRGESITTATDVYSLGVLLFQILTGESPLQFPSSAASDVERIICEVEPAAPSTVAKEHGRTLRGDLDNIVLMALRKEAARRYQSAQELDDDIRRYLSGLPVHAVRDTLRYRARKFVARHRMGAAVVGVFVAVVVSFVVIALEQAHRVRHERDRALSEQAKAEEVVGVLVNLFQQSNPYVVPGGDTLRVSDFIAQSEKSVSEMADHPDVQARMWEVLAEIHQARGDLPQARTFFERAQAIYAGDPAHDLDAARVFHYLARITLWEKGGAAAEPLLRESLARHRALLGDSHQDVAVAMRDLAGVIMNSHPEEAEQLLEAALAISRQHPSGNEAELAGDYNALGMMHLSRGEHNQARTNFERSLDFLKQVYPPEHPYVLTVAHNLAATCATLGDLETSEKMERELLATKRRVFGNDTPDVAGTLEALAITLTNEGRYDEAFEMYTEALHIYERTLGPDHSAVASTSRNLGVLMALRGRPAEGVPYLDRAMLISGEVSPRRSGAAYLEMQRAFVAYAAGQTTGAVPTARRVLAEIDSLTSGQNESYRAIGRVMLGTMLLDQGEAGEAEPLFRAAVDIRSARPNDSDPGAALARCLLGAALIARGQSDEGRELLLLNYKVVRPWGQLYPLERVAIEKAMRAVGLPLT